MSSWGLINNKQYQMETFWDFYISCFSFFLLDRPFFVHPSIILWLILKIKINEFFWCFLQLAKLQRQNYFSEPCIYILYSESGKVTLSLVCFIMLQSLCQLLHSLLITYKFSEINPIQVRITVVFRAPCN